MPADWHALCYITDQDTSHVDKACIDLLHDLRNVGDAADLLAKGGNFGCWRSRSHPDDDEEVSDACRDNYQQDLALSSCEDCTSLTVCIKYPDDILTTGQEILTTEQEDSATTAAPFEGTNDTNLVRTGYLSKSKEEFRISDNYCI